MALKGFLCLAFLLAVAQPLPELDEEFGLEPDIPHSAPAPPPPPRPFPSWWFAILVPLWVIVAARQAQRQQEQQAEEEESGDFYPEEQAMEKWEYKIIRNGRAFFDNPALLDKVLREEAQAGWELVEKFDGNRARLRRPESCRAQHVALPAGYDPLRSAVLAEETRWVARAQGSIALAVVAAVAAGAAAACLVFLRIPADGIAGLIIGSLAVLLALLAGWLSPGRSQRFLVFLGAIAVVGAGCAVVGLVKLANPPRARGPGPPVVVPDPVAGRPGTTRHGESTYQGRTTTFWIKLLRDKDPGYRRKAAEALQAIGPDAKETIPERPGPGAVPLRVVPALVEALGDLDENVRKAAAAALKKIDPEAAAKARAN